MKRTFFFVAALVGLACSGSGKSNGSLSGGATGTPSETRGAASASTSASTSAGGSAGQPGGGGGSGSGGTATGAGGSTLSGSGGTTRVGGGGAGSLGGGAGTGRTGGVSASGGTTRIEAGGDTAAGGSGGAVTPVATGPTAKDPTTAAADLTKYYLSNKGDDGNTGTSPEQAWATLGKIPKNKAVAVFFDKGGKWTITVGGTTRSGLSLAAGSVYASYGAGDKPLIYLDSTDQKTTVTAGVQLGGNNLVDGLTIKGYAVIGFPIGSNGNIVQNCEVDGTIDGSDAGTMQLGFSLSGQHNLIVGNYVHDLAGLSGDTGNVNTSGGSEAFVMNAGNNEVAYNKAVNCWVPNATLNGAEGGCLEIIGNKANELIENAFFHHNYCERSVGLFEACAGNFSNDGKKIQLNHAIVRNATVSYNVSIDAMWLYLLQPANTDFEGLVFEHNTLVHGPRNAEIPQGGSAAFGVVYDTDVVWTTGASPTTVPCSADTDCGEKELCLDYKGTGKACQYQFKLQPGGVTVRNNMFVVLSGAAAAMMTIPPGPNDFTNNLFAPKLPMSVKSGTAGTIVVSDAGLVDTYKLTATSPAVDKASPEALTAWVDWAGNKVPCGGAPDIGAFEYCP
jgi:hypothetical protein